MCIRDRYKGFILSSIISFLIAFFSEGITSYGAYLAGYSVLTIGIMMILLVLFNKTLSSQQGSTFQSFIAVFSTSSPLLIMLTTIAFLYYIIIIYKDKIIEGHISPSYFSFNNINLFLIFIQLYLLYNVINSKNFETSGIFPKLTSNIIILLGILTLISSINIYIILKYFTTDGFTTDNFKKTSFNNSSFTKSNLF